MTLTIEEGFQGDIADGLIISGFWALEMLPVFDGSLGAFSFVVILFSVLMVLILE